MWYGTHPKVLNINIYSAMALLGVKDNTSTAFLQLSYVVVAAAAGLWFYAI